MLKHSEKILGLFAVSGLNIVETKVFYIEKGLDHLKLNRISKIVIAKSLEKRHKSTRKLALKLNRMGNPVSKNTVHRYLKHGLGVTAYKRTNPPD